tara:strand:+ start:762 stop:953 length:192 start_codon:yes stop_codon:yes gene_type:complete
MEFVNEINEREKAKKVENSLEIGHIKYENNGVKFEIKDVAVKDVDSLRDFIYELLDEWERANK